MSEDNVEIVAECFRAWDRGDPVAVVANYATDVEVDASRVMEGVYRGRDAVLSYYRTIFETLGFANDDLRLVAAEDKVVAITRLHGVGAASGAEVETPFAYVFTLREGRVQRVCFYSDPSEALQSAGLSNSSLE
ncbi:MAG TPA: nuclear transport factor 2 family protein [Solirubrobacterales bacterium]|nr:nuclear transport factor 2 family protein [Solirubrobacterales bacterium]